MCFRSIGIDHLGIDQFEIGGGESGLLLRVGAAGSARGTATRTSGLGSAIAALIADSDAGVARGASNAKALALAMAGWP